ncbi:MAG: NADH-quinone oxidoreductase subunit NuoH [Anaerolineae bacterium]|jgi:NADH-quinone oxidoreductase subunit H
MGIINFILNFWVELGDWVAGVLSGWGVPQWGVNLIADIVGVVILLVVGVAAVLIFTPMERKVIGRMQDRPGPNRTPGYGAIQAVADAIKMLTKEDIIPRNADRFLHMLAPLLVAVPALLVYAVLPFGPRLVGQNLNVGILFVVAIGAVHVVAVLIAAWGSNNKYALLSGFRVVNQLLAYEIPMVLCILTVILFTKTMSLQGMVEAQTVPYFVVMPVTGLIFLVAALAEANRSPVDLIEADSEMVAGYIIEYSGMKFAMFFIAEYVNMFAVGILISTLFLGGWKFFGLEDLAPVLTPVIVFAKATFVIFVMLWFRATFPRMRFDHLVGFAWKFLVPLSLVNLFIAALVVKIPVADPVQEPWIHGGVMLLANIVVIIATAIILNRTARRVEGAPALKRIAAVER